MQHGPWQIVGSRTVHRDPWIDVRLDDVIRPDGKPGTHSLVTIKAGVSVLPVDAEGNAYLTQEFHYAVGRRTIEVVSGGIDPGEEPLAAARREAHEELGIEARQWTELGVVDPFTAMVVSPTRLFVAQDLRFDKARPEGTEQIECVKVPLAEAVQMVMESRITHGPSCVLILKAARTLNGE